MLFSILIANYNNSPFLRAALQSVINQTYSHWEVILVDDGSTDEFEEVIAPFVSDHRISIFRNDRNYGCGYTKKKCLSLARGSIAGFLDPDDALAPEALATMINAHEVMPGRSIIHSTHYICNEQLMPSRVADYTKSLPAGVPYLLLGDGRIHHFASFRKSHYDTTIGLSAENKKAVDQDLYYLLEEKGPVEFIDKPLYYYRIHSRSISTSGKEWESTLWHYKVIRDACMRRIKQIKSETERDHGMLRKYKLRYYKTGILESFRRKNRAMFIKYSFLFIFSGGIGNILGYLAKFPRQGLPLIRRTFYFDHQIKA
jgi:glycosyltransferase involved in cell wall biosynthesis